MTLSEVERMDVAARQRPELLGFDVIIVGNRVKIPREAFIAFMRGKGKGQCIG